jgi:hypothetical protein
MFLLTLPKGDTRGTCRINGKHAEYQSLDNPKNGPYIIWRYADENASPHWERRNILVADEGKDCNGVECISYTCDDGQGPGERPPYVLVSPTADGDIEVREM